MNENTQVYFTCIFVSSPVVFTIFRRLPFAVVIRPPLRALGLDTWLGGLLNYVSCLVGESTKCFGNGTDERNAKSTDGYQSFRFLVWENGWELDGMGFMKDYQLFWIVNQNRGSVNNESLQILWNIAIFIQVPLPWLLEKVSWICPGLIAPEKYPFFV